MDLPEPADLPGDKLYFSIGEVSETLNIERSTLRYWEQKFPQLQPSESPGGQRRYHREDIQTIQRIAYLLRDEKYTIEGARSKLNRWNSEVDPGPLLESILRDCERALDEIRSFLSSEPGED